MLAIRQLLNRNHAGRLMTVNFPMTSLITPIAQFFDYTVVFIGDALLDWATWWSRLMKDSSPCSCSSQTQTPHSSCPSGPASTQSIGGVLVHRVVRDDKAFSEYIILRTSGACARDLEVCHTHERCRTDENLNRAAREQLFPPSLMVEVDGKPEEGPAGSYHVSWFKIPRPCICLLSRVDEQCLVLSCMVKCLLVQDLVHDPIPLDSP